MAQLSNGKGRSRRAFTTGQDETTLEELASTVASASKAVDPEQHQRTIPLDRSRVVSAIEKVGHVPELVENITRFADSETQIRVTWNPYEDIELGSSQDLNATGGLSEPSDEDFQKFEQELLLLRELQESCDAARVTAQSPEWSGIYPPYWPARIYASKALPDHLKILHGQVRSRYSLNSYTNKWHDFTQFKTNPYVQTVFAQQLTESVEAYEFKLQSLDQINNLIFGTTPHL
ncbi:hypothetical protein J4E91_002913 [Alternaria rosae]|nr:hypothetical protein J4E91_002913 [Alternaria rosae]